uniref:Down syndrome cell adhesion molecule-like protein Dscam2 n=1 Tax=Cacopsylla melanoneura TaxID=428564 RepID=A0A8D8LZQ1_9HEMI
MLNSVANRHKINLTDERLHVRNVVKEDKGMYQCFISNDMDMVQATCEIQLGDASPELIYKFSDQTLQPGPALSLKCEATGNPPPQFVWTLDGFAIPENNRFVVGQYVTIHDDVISHLNISSVKDEDGGEYSCTARNSIATVSHSARINIYGPPFIRPMSKVIAVAGKDLTMKCPVGGYPIESIVWEKEGKLLPLDMRHKVLPNGVLKIETVNKLTDSGTYLCQAKNHEKQVYRRDVQVYVSTPPKILPMPPALSGILREGQRVALTCQILEGDLPLSFEWKKDARYIQGVSSAYNIQGGSGIVIRRVDEFTSSLVIEKIHSMHSGNYTCLVNNNAGTDEASVQLIVNVPPRWTFEPLDQNIKAGHSVTMHCQAEGYPKPSITWKKSVGVDTTEYKDFSYEPNVRQHGNGTLEFTSVAKSNQGHYLCEAKNNIGSGISKVVFLRVNSPPTFPQKTKQVTVMKGEKAHLMCKAEGDNPLEIRWRIEGKRVNEDVDPRFSIREQVLEEGMISELGIANVFRQDSGTLSCLATNYHGTAEMTIQLLVQETPESPKNIRIAEESSRSLQISWTQPYAGNTAITQYIIQYKTSEEAWPSQPLKIIVPGSQTSATLQPLLPATQYQVRLVAENPLGMSETGGELQATTLEEAPNGAPKEVTSETLGVEPTELLIKWKAPARESWNGILLGYDVGYQISSGSSLALSSYTMKSVEIDNQYEGELRMTGLSPHTKYAIVVRAYNSVGKGPFSEPFIARTNEGAPSRPPDNIACASVTATSLKITWETVPTDARNGVIQGYKVVYYPSEDWYESLDSNLTKTFSLSATLQGLKKFTNYSVQVLAFTQAGDGMPSDQNFCRTLEDVPAAPTAIKAALMSPSKITVTWLPPSPSNGPLISYTLYWRILGPGAGPSQDAAPHKKLLRPNSVEYFIDVRGGPDSGGSYQFWIAAATGVGEGPPSRLVAVFPSKKVPAKITSFSQTIKTPYKLNMSLDCKHVGNPPGTMSWFVNEKPLLLDTVGMRLQIKDHALVIKEIQHSDQKNYTCRVENNHGSDEITYNVIVRVPPEPPELMVVAQELDALHLKWIDRAESSIPILGYTINYKREHGDWEEVHIVRHQRASYSQAQGHTEGQHNTYLLENLWCGTRYQLYITAHNRIGTGLPCDIVHTRTKGSVPIAPGTQQILTFNSTGLSVWLDAWSDGGCPMLYHVLEIRQFGPSTYPWGPPRTVQPSERVYTISDLQPGTSYQLRATAHNNIGATVMVYNFTTLTIEGGTIAPNILDPDLPSHSTWLSFSSLFLLLSLLLIGLPSLYVIYLYSHKRHKQNRGDILAESASIAQLQNQHNRDQQYGSRGSHQMDGGPNYKPESTGYIEDICPYATFQLAKPPPGSISSPYEESTYSGNVYSGPYHSVRGTFVYHQPKTPSIDYKRHLREPEYTKVRRQGGKLRDPHSESQESDNLGSTDSEVKKILTLHLPISEYDAMGSEDSEEEEVKVVQWLVRQQLEAVVEDRKWCLFGTGFLREICPKNHLPVLKTRCPGALQVRAEGVWGVVNPFHPLHVRARSNHRPRHNSCWGAREG